MNNYKFDLIIKEFHLDFMGHVNNATYLTIFEEARWEMLLNHGYTLNDIKKSGVGPVILECNIKFLKEITLRENITIESSISNLENKIGYINQEIINEKNDICTKAKFTYGFFDIKERKLVNPPSNFIEILKQ